MAVYKTKIQSDGNIEKLKLIIVVISEKNEIIGDTWSPTGSMRSLKYLLEYTTKHKAG